MKLFVKLIVFLCVFNISLLKAQNDNPWNFKELSKEIPSFKFIECDTLKGVKALVYKSGMYKGKQRDVFAYYSSPGILKGDPSLDKNLPVVLCIHGGGGNAFDEWVKIWASKGYAALSMDLYGNSWGDRKIPLQNGFKIEEGTSITKAFVDYRDDWFYQAIIDVIKAHSLVRSFREVDPDRTAVTGISWGGIMTTLLAGLDKRFKVAVPVYGCGYLYKYGAIMNEIKAQGDLALNRWKEMYDPSHYVSKAAIPMLFVNGTNDFFFYMNQWEKTTDLVKKANRTVYYKMSHGHTCGWNPIEIYRFVDKHLGIDRNIKIPVFKKIKNRGNNQFTYKVKNISADAIVSILYSKSDKVNNEADWKKIKLDNIDKQNIQFQTPDGCSMWMLEIEQNNMHFNSPLSFNEKYLRN